MILGTAQNGPNLTEILTALANPQTHVVVNLVGLPLHDRPAFSSVCFHKILELRAASGRPHWISSMKHHLPRDGNPGARAWRKDSTGMMYVTVHPDQIDPAILNTVDLVFALGQSPGRPSRPFAKQEGQQAPTLPSTELESRSDSHRQIRRVGSRLPEVLENRPSTERRNARHKCGRRTAAGPQFLF